MNENFTKFKKKVWTDIIIKCVIAAVAAGLVAVNAVLLPCKLCGINVLWVYYVLIAFGGILLGGGIAFLFLRTNDKKIAVRLDNELNLNERVQTTLHYNSASGDMIAMLKADTDGALSSMPARTLPFKNVIATALCAVVALVGLVAVPVISFTVPPVFATVKTDNEPNLDPPRTVTDWEYAALDDLIKYVQNSKKMDGAVKSGMLDALEGLKTVLLSGVTQNSLKTFVQSTVSSITNCVKDANEQYPVGANDEPHPQAKANSEEETYVITTLYDIFGLLPNNGDGDDTPGGNNPGEGDDPTEPGELPPDILNENETPFFDPKLGYVTCGSARAEYMYKVQKALEEGTISSEEWEYIMIKYFADLGKTGNED